jgi:hypothetical protein
MSRSFSFAGEDIDATDFKPASSVFYLDVSENVLVPKLIKYIQMNGGVRKRQQKTSTSVSQGPL